MITMQAIENLRADLNSAVADNHARDYTTEPDRVTARERKDFWALDIGTSGAFMVRKADGAIFGIKGYGTPDYRKGIAYLGEISGADLLTWRFRRGPFNVSMKEVRQVFA